MFTKILVATDVSDASNNAIAILGCLRALGAKEALLIHCVSIRDVGTLANQVIAFLQPSFERQKKTLQEQGFETTANIILGQPQIEISHLAKEQDCSLIVVGSHGETIAREVQLGSVASAVIHSALRPVLVLRMKRTGEEARKEWEWDCLRHILFPTDFSDNAEHAFRYVQNMADCGAKKITLLHVQDKSKIDRHLKERLEEFNRIDTERLGRLRTDLEERGVKDIRIEIPYGIPKKELIARTRADDVSLVVMGSQGRGYISEMFLGSVSHAVARHSEVPVLLIPAMR